MKKIIFILATVLLMSCASAPMDPANTVTVTTKFYVTEVYKAKYSKVEGYVLYNGIKIPASNGSTGYYYKDYRLKAGDAIDVAVNITTKYGWNYVQLITSDIDLSNYTTEQ